MFWGVVVLFSGVVITIWGSLNSRTIAQGENISALQADNENRAEDIAEIKSALGELDDKVDEVLIKLGGRALPVKP